MEIEPPNFDWFAEFPMTVAQGDAWFVVNDGLGSLFLLSTCDGNCFVRRLTGHEQPAFCELTGIVRDVEPEGDDAGAAPRQISSAPETPANQQTLR